MRNKCDHLYGVTGTWWELTYSSSLPLSPQVCFPDPHVGINNKYGVGGVSK